MEEWQRLKSDLTPRYSVPMVHWRPPEEGWHKVNTDGSFSRDSGWGGGGAVLRDHHGEFSAGACHFFPLASDPERTELLACRRGVQLAQQMGVSKLVLKSDFLNAVTKLRSQDVDRSVHGPLVEEVKEMLGTFDDHAIKHIRRTGNEVAHRFAKDGCENKLCKS
ncbi:hypothetical protein ACQ4PT_045377 [Festuca glaucescens]